MICYVQMLVHQHLSSIIDTVHVPQSSAVSPVVGRIVLHLPHPLSPNTHTTTTHSTALRVSRSARPTSLDGGPKSTAPVTVGKKGKDFEFSDLSLKVQFVECSARGKGAEGESVADIDDVLEWLNKQC